MAVLPSERPGLLVRSLLGCVAELIMTPALGFRVGYLFRADPLILRVPDGSFHHPPRHSLVSATPTIMPKAIVGSVPNNVPRSSTPVIGWPSMMLSKARNP